MAQRLVTVKGWAWAEKEAQEAFQQLPSAVQEELEEKLGQRVGEVHSVGNRREVVRIEGRVYVVWTFLDTDGTLHVTVPPAEA